MRRQDELPGVELVLDAEGKARFGLDHERAGELVAVAEPDAWFTYLSGGAIATSRSTAETYGRRAIEALAGHRQALDERVLEGVCQLLLRRSK